MSRRVRSAAAESSAVLRLLQERFAEGRPPLRSPELARAAGCSERSVRAAVSELRQRGEPICSGDQGYWYSTDPEELRATMRHLRSRAMADLAVYSGMKRAMRAVAVPTQGSLFT